MYDKETGLYYLRARYYDPSTGRFLNEDSYEGQINNPLTLNLYTYAHNNPILYKDSSGHYVESFCDLPNIVLDGVDIGLDFYTGDYWSILLDIPSLIGDGVALAVPIIPGGIGSLKTPLRVGKSIKSFDKIKDSIKSGRILGFVEKAFIRREGRSFLLKNSINFAKAIERGIKIQSKI